MKMALHFELVTPAKLVRSEDVYMVVVPGGEGDFGVRRLTAAFSCIPTPCKIPSVIRKLSKFQP